MLQEPMLPYRGTQRRLLHVAAALLAVAKAAADGVQYNSVYTGDVRTHGLLMFCFYQLTPPEPTL